MTSNAELTSEEQKTEEKMPGYPSVQDFSKEGYKVVMEALKASNSLPCDGDLNFYMTFDSFKKTLSQKSNSILRCMNSLLRHNEVGGNMCNNMLESKTELLIEACDVLFERIANNIDELNGIRKTDPEPIVFQTVSMKLPVNGSWNRASKFKSSEGKDVAQTFRLITAENILRPQKFFKDKVDNSRKNPWEPHIKEKPNSLKPLAIFLEETELGEQFSHPYEYELDRFSPPIEQLRKCRIVRPNCLSNTPLVEINETDQLENLVNELRNFEEIAVDLEHHSYRSFMGITCLMQISTCEKDYLIDTLALRDKVNILNDIFTDPKKIKIFHGADHDIEWLQRDLSLYIVNMFDTHIAAKQLEYSSLSLAYLMKRFCNFMPNKQFQLADWRIRPLPDELKSYAREDTHYLIYIYQKMRNELIEKANGQNNLLKSVIQNSTILCKKRYIKPVFTEESHLNLYRRCNRLFDNRQLFALSKLYDWRDQISREEDESTGYVLPNNMLLEISERLPREMQGILACCNPVPPLVRANLLDLHKTVLKALEKPHELPILKEDTRARGATAKASKINIDSPLYCPHDLTRATREMSDNLPTLLQDKGFLNLDQILTSHIEESCSRCSVFNAECDNRCLKVEGKLIKEIKFFSPYKRYKLTKPFIEARESKLIEAVTKEKQNEDKLDDDRTDEERIEAVREHFLNLANKPANIKPDEENGIKEKSEDVPNNSIFNVPYEIEKDANDSVQAIILESSINESANDSVQALILESSIDESANDSAQAICVESSIDEDKIKKFSKNRKRKSDVVLENKPKRNKKNRYKPKANKQNYSQIEDNQSISNLAVSETTQGSSNSQKGPYNQGGKKKNFQQNKKWNRNKNKSKANKQDQIQANQYASNPSISQSAQHSNTQQNKKENFYQNKKWKGRKKKGSNSNPINNDTPQSKDQSRERNQFAAYDYSMVDFRQFQGGARQAAQRPKAAIKSKFKAKGKRRNYGNWNQNKN